MIKPKQAITIDTCVDNTKKGSQFLNEMIKPNEAISYKKSKGDNDGAKSSQSLCLSIGINCQLYNDTGDNNIKFEK